jgi:uncharacterized membrane protein YgcG
MKKSAVLWMCVGVIISILSMSCLSALAQTLDDPPPAAEVTPDKWPLTKDVAGATYTIYQPQLKSWDGYHLEAVAAVSVLPQGAQEPIFGVIQMTAVTEVDRQSRAVSFYSVQIPQIKFPSAPDQAGTFQDGFLTLLSQATTAASPSLDRMQAALAVQKAEKVSHGAPLKNDPPAFIFSQQAAILVPIDGEPVWRTVKQTGLVRVLNTRALILGDTSGKVYLHLYDGFLEAPGLSGPWTPAGGLPDGIQQITQELADGNIVDLMEGSPNENSQGKPSLQNGVPQIIVPTSPTELIVSQGPMNWAPVAGTMLLYVSNTTGNIFRNMNDQTIYVLVTGRWFKAADLAGPWQYVEGRNLPKDFFAISDDSPKENVKAALPGTPQAQEARIANDIPQTARVDRAQATFTPTISGKPDLRPIPDTPLQYVFNASMPIICVTQTQWLAVQSGVWFTASAVSGPWSVATAVPPVIYSIPPSSSLYYVTYVKVYDVTPEYVVTGYTPGYMGTIVNSEDVIVYGSGYDYEDYIGDMVWFSQPVTYGYAANPTWTPWTGWAVGFGLGWAFGAATDGYYCYAPAPYWGPMPYSPYSGYARGPYSGAAVWGPGGWAATTGNVYQKWGPTTAVSRTSAGYNAWTGNAWSSKVGTSYNSTTGRISAGQRADVQNVYTGNYAYSQRGATYNPNTGVAARGGTATVGNAETGTQKTADWAHVKGPDGQSTSAAKVGNNFYADHDGNIYKNTGDGWQKYDSGSWNDINRAAAPTTETRQPDRQTERQPVDPISRPETMTTRETDSVDSLEAQRQAREAGDHRSAAASWGSENWGGGFAHSGGGMESGMRERERGFEGGGRSWGGGGFGGGRMGRR